MSGEFEVLFNNIGSDDYSDMIVLRGKCPFCGDSVSFRQYGSLERSRIIGRNVTLICEGCASFVVYSLTEQKLYPTPILKGLEDLPEDIQKYYDEGLRCIASSCPNGAVTLFRKVIHELGIYYGISKKNDDKNLYDIINELEENGHIVPKLKNALLSVKDIGNDGAHVNENEPDIEQASALKHLIEVVLNSTVLADKKMDFVKEKHSKK